MPYAADPLMIEKQGLQREMDWGTMHRTLFRLVSSKAPLTLRESGVKFTDLKLYSALQLGAEQKTPENLSMLTPQ